MNDADATKPLRELLQKIAIEQRYYDNNVITIKPTRSGGTNFTSQVYEATIVSPNKADLNLFIKVAAQSETVRRSDPTNIFDKERIFYTEIARTYDMLQDKHDIRGEDRIVFPKFYGCNPEYMQETLVLENLKSNGMTSHDRLKSVTWQYAAMAVDVLAKFHGLSLALERENSDANQKLLKEMAIELPYTMAKLLEIEHKMFMNAISVVREDLKSKVLKYIDDHREVNAFFHYMKPLVCPVLGHGDYRTSNLMHKECDNGRIHFAVLDYQTLRTSSTVADLIYFIFSSTDQEFRRQNYDRLIEYYYGKLREAASRFDVDLDSVYPRKDFDYELKKTLPLGVTIAMTALSLEMVEHGDVPAVGTMTLVDLAVKPNAAYAHRLNGIIEDFVAWGEL